MKRIVTGIGPDGRSAILSADEPPVIFQFGVATDPHTAVPQQLSLVPDALPARNAVLAELFASNEHIPSLDNDITATLKSWDVECPAGATRFRLAMYGAYVEA